MKQLMIVNSAQSVSNSAAAALNAGQIRFMNFDNTILSAKPTTNFYIQLGRPNNQIPFTFSEVDVKTLSVVKSAPVAAEPFVAAITIPTPADVINNIPYTHDFVNPIPEYGIVFIKKATVPHERNTWTVQVATQASTAAEVATKLADAIKAKANDLFPFTASTNGAALTVTCLNDGEDWDIAFIDCLESLNGTSVYTDGDSDGIIDTKTIGSAVTITLGRKAIGDMADIQDLASRCAAGKGFTDTYRNGDTIYPGYPETVQDTTYNVWTLRFRVGRDSAKTRDERVWQILHIAVPTTATSVDTAINTLFEDFLVRQPAETRG